MVISAYPAALKTATDIAGVLRRLHDNLGGGTFRFTTVEKLIREILSDYPDPYDVTFVLLQAMDARELDMGGEVWNTLDVRAYSRLHSDYKMPAGMGRYAYLAYYVADAHLRQLCYLPLASWEDAVEADDTQSAAAAKAELDKLLEAFLGQPSAHTSRS